MTEESFKGWYHVVLAIVFAIALGYNVMRFVVTRKPRNLVNVCLYTAALLWELRQVKDHWSRG